VRLLLAGARGFFSLRIGGFFHVKSCVSAVIDFVLLHIPYVGDNSYIQLFPGFATTSGVSSSFTTGSTFCLPNTYNMAQAEEISLEAHHNQGSSSVKLMPIRNA
jgi:hypothetical protein